jgi:hypothetical protein
MKKFEIILEGQYKYLQDSKVYSEENFKLTKEDRVNGEYILEAETLTRTRTGEFLKTTTQYGFTENYHTTNVSVQRTLGPRSSEEKIHVNQREKTCLYTFSADDKKHNQELYFSGYLCFATPCFSASMLMTQMKKIDPVHRTQYSILSSENIWEYTKEVKEHDVYVELQELEPVSIVIANNDLKATHCKLLQVDENGTIATEGHNIYLSKNHSIPYKGIFDGGIVIEIEKLKSFESKYKNIFK